MDLVMFNDSREFTTVNIGGKDHQIKLAGTTEDPYFCGKDVCAILGYESIKKALQNNVDDDDKKFLSELGNSGCPNSSPSIRLGKVYTSIAYHEGKAVYVSEAGLYSLILSSKAPFAKEFRRIVTRDILPSIRKYGVYSLNHQMMLKDKEIEAERAKREAADQALKAADQAREEEHKKRVAAENYSTILKDMLIKADPIQKTQCVYISTAISYAKQNRFKVGGVETSALLPKRLSTYNSNRTAGDEWYFADVFHVPNYKNVEQHLNSLIGRFRDKASKEIYHMHYDSLSYIVKYICERFNDDTDEVNANLSEFISKLDLSKEAPVVPPPSRQSFATVTHLSSGEQTSIQATSPYDLEAKIISYLSTLPCETTKITKKQAFDAIKLRSGRIMAYNLLEHLSKEIRPDLILSKR